MAADTRAPGVPSQEFAGCVARSRPGRGNALCPCGTQLTAALGLSCLSDPLRGEHDFCLLPREARSAVKPNAYNLSGVRFGRPPLLKWRRAGDEPRSCTHHALD